MFSIYATGFGVIGIALAATEGESGTYDTGFVQIAYVLLLPARMFGVVMVADYWVEGLPSQVGQQTRSEGVVMN